MAFHQDQKLYESLQYDRSKGSLPNNKIQGGAPIARKLPCAASAVLLFCEPEEADQAGWNEIVACAALAPAGRNAGDVSPVGIFSDFIQTGATCCLSTGL